MSGILIDPEHHELRFLEHWLASGEILPSQMPTSAFWSPEKKLAAAVFASGLVTIRNHAHDPARRKEVAEDIAWVFSDDTSWPYSFLRLCELFRLDPGYVRRIVRTWIQEASPLRRKMCSTHRHAA